MSVAKKILEVMKQVDYLQMDKKLQAGPRYRYLSEEKVTGEIHEKAVAVGLIVVPTSMEILQSDDISTKEGTTHNVRILAGYSWIDPEDDSKIEARVMGEASDTGDKALPKAMTSVYKSLMLQTFMISRGQGEESEGNGNNCEGLLENGDPCPVELTQGQAEYSTKAFGSRLCPACQKREAARTASRQKSPSAPATTTADPPAESGPSREELIASVNAGFERLGWLKSKQIKFIYDSTDQRRGQLDACTDAELAQLVEKLEAETGSAESAKEDKPAAEGEIEDPFKD